MAMLMVATGADLQLFTQHRFRPSPVVSIDESVLHVDCFAKCAAAFLKVSNPILVLASSARKRANTICSGVTGLVPGPPSRLRDEL